ncbi:MAG: hypothetical protein ACYDGR_14410 [Candidatus Dormibacteria bacterium]
MSRRRSELATRLPPIIMGLLALGLMVAILPSSLRLPTTGPGAAAEVVPGPNGQAPRNTIPNLNAAQGGTVGSGGDGPGSAPTSLPTLEVIAGLPGRSVPQQAHCVGRPARQTEDPLSPPCVATWQGNNGGSTSRGVDGDVVTVVLYSPYAFSADYNAPVRSSDSPFTRTVKVLLRYFQSRFQTYGRTVQLIPQRAGSNPASDASQASGYRPFAAVPLDGRLAYFLQSASDRTLTFSSTSQPLRVFRQTLQSNAPYIWSLTPDVETIEASTATYICRQLVGGRATQAPSPTLRVRPRTFGEVYQDDAVHSLLDANLQQTCGLQPLALALKQDSDAVSVQAQLNAGGISTIIDLAPDHDKALEQQATTNQYLPEWVIDSYEADDLQFYGRQHSQASWAGAFGPTWRWVAPRAISSYWFQAYREVDPSHDPDPWRGMAIYNGLLQLFSAIQQAGPHLTAADVQRGLDGRRVAGADQFSPSGGYSAGDHALINDFMLERWSPTGTPPGGRANSGCYLLMGAGARYQGGGWPTGDAAAGGGGCDGDDIDSATQAQDQEGTAG